MGYYIETGTIKGKAEVIEKEHESTIIPQPKSFKEVPEGKALICVMDNGMFEAAAYIYSSNEFRDFTLPEDHRYKVWLLMDLEKAEVLTGRKPAPA